MRRTRLVGRVLIGAALAVAVFLIVRYAPAAVLTILVAAWSGLATLEFLRLLRRADVRLNSWLLVALNVTIVAAAWLGWLPGYLIAPIGIVLFLTATFGESRPRVPVYGVFVLVYLGLLPAHLVLLHAEVANRGLSTWLVLFPLILTWTGDTTAWAFGHLFGRRPLSRISPNKTWEGTVAGLIACGILAALVLSRLEPLSGRPWPLLATFGLGLGTLSQAGDLFESMFKRAVGVKDSSGALGEHGGFLDRADSLLFTVPAWLYLLRIYLP